MSGSPSDAADARACAEAALLIRLLGLAALFLLTLAALCVLAAVAVLP